MSVAKNIISFIADERAAVTVDWTVLSSAAVGLAIATTAMMTDTLDMMSGQMDNELRTRQMGDEWVQFIANHFEPILETGYVSESAAETLYDEASGLMNHAVVTHLTNGIEALEAGTITADELVGLVALASVAQQRNIVDDGILDYYFGFGGSDPFYMTVANAPAAGG